MDTFFCPHCGQPHPAGTPFCPATGKKLLTQPRPSSPPRVLLYVIGALSLVCGIVVFGGYILTHSSPSVPTRGFASTPTQVAPFLQAGVPIQASASSTHLVPTSVPMQTSESTAVTPDQATSVPSPTEPSVTHTTQLLHDPADFIRWYFAAVWQDRNYDYLWTLQTPAFQASSSPGGYAEYAGWWDSVRSVKLNSVNRELRSPTSASVEVKVTFRLKDGQVLANRLFHYDLTYDGQRSTWLFDIH